MLEIFNSWSFFLGYLCGFITLVPVVFWIIYQLGKIAIWRR